LLSAGSQAGISLYAAKSGCTPIAQAIQVSKFAGTAAIGGYCSAFNFTEFFFLYSFHCLLILMLNTKGKTL
jgi:hypothetical protein